MNRTFPKLADVACQIETGDLLLDWDGGLVEEAIEHFGESEYYHASMAAWWDTDLMLLEMTDGGGQAVILSERIRRLDHSKIDVFAMPLTLTERWKAVHEMRLITNVPYGWRTLVLLGLMRRWPGRVLVPAYVKWRGLDLPDVCSSVFATAVEKATGVDPFPDLEPWRVRPAELAKLWGTEESYRFSFNSNSV